jgi:hypothetical protein
MIEIKINSRGTGACPQCRYSYCHIATAIRRALEDEVEAKHDNEIEIVIYRCPEFEEK